MQTANLRGQVTAQLLMVDIIIRQKGQDLEMKQVIWSKTELYPHKEIMVDKPGKGKGEGAGVWKWEGSARLEITSCPQTGSK